MDIFAFQEMAAYLAGGRYAMKQSFEQTPIISITLDESNVRGLELCNAGVVAVDGTLVWAPTQVDPYISTYITKGKK